MAKAAGLISLLLDIASFRDVLFCQLQQLQRYIMVLPMLTFVLICAPFLSPIPHW